MKPFRTEIVWLLVAGLSNMIMCRLGCAVFINKYIYIIKSTIFVIIFLIYIYIQPAYNIHVLQ